MKKLTIVALALVIFALGVSLAGCGSSSNQAQVMESQILVQRGNLSVGITAAGNLALSRAEDLAFEIAGTVEEVLVAEGDTVEEGQVLAKLDTSEWEDTLATLASQLTTKKRALPQAEVSLKNAEIALAKAQDVYHYPEIQVAQADVDIARANLQYSLDGIQQGKPWDNLANRERLVLDAAEAKLNAMLTGADPDDIAIKKLQVEIAKGQMEDAQKAVADAQKALDEAKSKSPVITAPFAGFITKVNVEGGDDILKGTVAVQLADPAKFQADIAVSEMDISQVKLGGEASVQVDALSGLSVPAKVTHIAPTSTIQSGVVNYKVKVELESPAAPTSAAGDVQLREGLTATVSIIVQQKTNVLLVPNAAITSQSGQSYVQVVTSTGTPEKRAIKTGITDYTNTEVIEGLSEGEKVIVQQAAATNSSTSSKQNQSSPGMMIPGMTPPPPGR